MSTMNQLTEICQMPTVLYFLFSVFNDLLDRKYHLHMPLKIPLAQTSWSCPTTCILQTRQRCGTVLKGLFRSLALSVLGQKQ